MTAIILAILLGSAFGFALYNAGAADRKKIRAMLRLENLELMKIILFAIGLASFLLSASALLGIFNIGHLSIKAMNAGVILGGLIFGVGFGLVGSCPGTSLASLPYPNKAKTLGIILGGLSGALAYSLSYGWWEQLGLFSALDMGKLTLFAVTKAGPSVSEIGFSGQLIAGALFMLAAWALPEKIRQ